MMCRKHVNMQMMVQMLLVVLGLFCCSHVSQALKCHSCQTISHENCGEPFTESRFEFCDMSGENAICYKKRVVKQGQLMIYFCA